MIGKLFEKYNDINSKIIRILNLFPKANSSYTTIDDAIEYNYKIKTTDFPADCSIIVKCQIANISIYILAPASGKVEKFIGEITFLKITDENLISKLSFVKFVNITDNIKNYINNGVHEYYDILKSVFEDQLAIINKSLSENKEKELREKIKKEFEEKYSKNIETPAEVISENPAEVISEKPICLPVIDPKELLEFKKLLVKKYQIKITEQNKKFIDHLKDYRIDENYFYAI